MRLSSCFNANCSAQDMDQGMNMGDVGLDLPGFSAFDKLPKEKFERMARYNFPLDHQLNLQGVNAVTITEKPSDHDTIVHFLKTAPQHPKSDDDIALSNPVIGFERLRQVNMELTDRRHLLSDLFLLLTGHAIPDLKATYRTFNNVESLNSNNAELAAYSVDPLPEIQPAVCWGSKPPALDQLNQGFLDCARFAIPHLGGPAQGGVHLVAPNMFLEVAMPHESFSSAVLECRYEGAFGARAVYVLAGFDKNNETVNNGSAAAPGSSFRAHQVAADRRSYNGSALAFSAAYGDGQLRLYSHWLHVAHQPALTAGPAITVGQQPQVGLLSNRQVEFRMAQLGAWSMTGDVETFRKGVVAFRNLARMARVKRRAAVRESLKR